MDIVVYVVGSLIAVLALCTGALILALLLALGIRFLEDREQDRMTKQKTIPPPPWPGHKPPPIPPDHARVMARPPMFTPEPAAVTPEVPPRRSEEDPSDLPTDGNNDRPRGKWDDDPTEDGPNLTLISELTNPPTPVRMEAPKTTPRRSMFRNLFRRDKPR